MIESRVVSIRKLPDVWIILKGCAWYRRYAPEVTKSVILTISSIIFVTILMHYYQKLKKMKINCFKN